MSIPLLQGKFDKLDSLAYPKASKAALKFTKKNILSLKLPPESFLPKLCFASRLYMMRPILVSVGGKIKDVYRYLAKHFPHPQPHIRHRVN